MPNFRRTSFERGATQREGRDQMGVPIALHHLRGRGVTAKAKRLQHASLDRRRDAAIGTDCATELADRNVVKRGAVALPVATELVPPASELEAEGDRLGR